MFFFFLIHFEGTLCFVDDFISKAPLLHFLLGEEWVTSNGQGVGRERSWVNSRRKTWRGSLITI
jgi:hypothetical protein